MIILFNICATILDFGANLSLYLFKSWFCYPDPNDKAVANAVAATEKIVLATPIALVLIIRNTRRAYISTEKIVSKIQKKCDDTQDIAVKLSYLGKAAILMTAPIMTITCVTLIIITLALRTMNKWLSTPLLNILKRNNNDITRALNIILAGENLITSTLRRKREQTEDTINIMYKKKTETIKKYQQRASISVETMTNWRTRASRWINDVLEAQKKILGRILNFPSRDTITAIQGKKGIEILIEVAQTKIK